MKLSLTDFRAFASTDALEIRPLTFLVGENSSGKTSFLAALSYVWRLQERMLSASFNLPPFDLGTFDEIVHRVRGRTKPQTFALEIENDIVVDPRRSPLYISRGTIEKSSGLARLRLTFSNSVGDATIRNLDLNYEDCSLQIIVSTSLKIIVTKNRKIIFDSNDGQRDLLSRRRISQLERFDMSDILFYLRHIVRDSTSPKEGPPRAVQC